MTFWGDRQIETVVIARMQFSNPGKSTFKTEKSFISMTMRLNFGKKTNY